MADLKKLNEGIARAKKRPAKRPDPVTVDAVKEMVETAVDKVVDEVSKIKPQKITIPARKPVSYRATIERRGGLMTGARIDPIVND